MLFTTFTATCEQEVLARTACTITEQGIALIGGGGYHGKSTLLNALEFGVYNHIAGDGREYVITDASALKLCSEDGRFVKDVII